jgi:hypothetical protein
MHALCRIGELVSTQDMAVPSELVDDAVVVDSKDGDIAAAWPI